MPMIDVYATAGVFGDKHQLATDLAAAVVAIERVPDTGYVRIPVVTNEDALDRDSQLAVVARLTAIATGNPSQSERTQVLLTEAPDGGWGIAGHVNTSSGLAAACARLASIQAGGPATKN